MSIDVFHRSRRSLTLYYASSMAFFAVILIVLVYNGMIWAISSEQAEELTMAARDIARAQTYLLQHPGLMDEEEFNAAKGNRDRLFYYCFDNEGKLLNYARATLPVEEFTMTIIKAQLLELGEVSSFTQEEAKKPHMRIMMTAEPMLLEGEMVGSVYVGRELTAVFKGLKKCMFIFGGIAVLALAVATVIGHFMAGKAIIPLREAYEKQRQFAADASHELRTPLSIIMASAEILEKDKNITSPFLQQVVADVHDEVRKMTKLVSDLLVVARSDNEVLKLKLSRIDLVATAEQTLRTMRPLAEKKKISLTRDGDESIIANVDEAKFKQLLLILVDNALKYTPDGGSVALQLLEKSGVVTLSVSDTGIGIAKEDLSRVFDRFYRVDKARSREMGGNGLGLAIAHELTHLFGGRIKVESELGEGTTFTVTWRPPVKRSDRGR